MTEQEKYKIENEPYYNDLYKKFGIDYCLTNGFYFNETAKVPNWEQHKKIPCTPINFLKEKLSQSKNPCIIISTGAHCPMHDGHVEIMKIAKQKLETKGYDVIGGYLSPGHDNYIKEKNGDQWMPVHDRLHFGKNLIDKEDWLAIDPWEGVYAPGSVNFTTVVYRLQQYLYYWLKRNIKIFYVCGADNARFHHVFKDTEIGTVISARPGYVFDYSDIVNHHNVFVIDSTNSLSSTEIRKGIEYQTYLKNKNVSKQLYLRMNWTNVEKTVLVELRKWFPIVTTQDIELQQQSFNHDYNITVNDAVPILNLDSSIKHTLNLEISRFYDNHGQKHLGHINRPSSDVIMKQIRWIKQFTNIDECVLFDDDIHTGKTMQFVESELNKEGVKVIGKYALVKTDPQSTDTEILDAKDFILGYQDGGLVTQIGKFMARVPYFYPFVCPKTRASINDPLQFSINMWKLNMEYYDKNNVTLQEKPNLKFLYKLGFNKYSTLYDICKYYHDFLINLQ